MPIFLFDCCRLLADGEAPGGAPAAGQGPPGFGFFLPLAAMAVLFYFLILRPQRKKEAEQKSLLGSVKQNDRVVTIGGIHGVVTNVQRDADRVTVRVDDSNNTKISFTFSAISRILSDAGEGEKSPK